MNPPDPYRQWPQDTIPDSSIFSGRGHISCIFKFLSLKILKKWKNVHVHHLLEAHAVSCGVMVFLIGLCFLFCPIWGKYSWYQESTSCCLSQLLKSVDLNYRFCNKVYLILQYVELSYEVSLSPIILILFPWLLLVLWRSTHCELELFLIVREVWMLLLFYTKFSGYLFFQPQIRKSIFKEFTHLITESNVNSLAVCFFSFLPKIWMIQNNNLSKTLLMIDTCSWVESMCHTSHDHINSFCQKHNDSWHTMEYELKR
jgi:hypothetical protein